MKIKFLFVLFLILGCASKNKSPKYPGILPKYNDIEVSDKVSEAELAFGKDIYENVCNNCHKLYQTKSFDKAEWKVITNRMQDKTHLNDIDIQNVYRYIISTLN